MFTVFEEDNNRKPKMYDLTIGVFETFEEAEKCAEYHFNHSKENVYIADSEAYENGNYDYIRAYVK